jgi:hypothetical protein
MSTQAPTSGPMADALEFFAHGSPLVVQVLLDDGAALDLADRIREAVEQARAQDQAEGE